MPEDAYPASIPERRSVAKNAFALFASQTFTWVLATIVTTVQPRFLGPIGQGQLRVAVALWTIITLVAAFGTTTLLTIEVAKDPLVADSLQRRSMRIRLISFSAVVPGVALFLWLGHYDRGTIVISILLGASTLFALASGSYTGVLLGLREMGKTSRIDAINKLVFTVLLIVVLLAGGGVVGVAAVGVALAVFGLVQTRLAYSGSLPNGQREAVLRGRSLFRLGGTFLLADAALVVYQQVDTIVMSQLVGPKAIGWYATADVLFGSLLFIPVLLSTALFPEMAEKFHLDPAAADALLSRTFRSLLLLAVPIGVGTIVVAKSFVSLLYGPSFAQTTDVLQIYGVVVILEFVVILLSRFAQATGQVRFWTIMMAIAIAATIPLDIVFVPWCERTFHNGAMGGALSYVVTEGVILVVACLRIARSMLTRATMWRVLKCLVGGTAMFAVGWPLREKFFLVSAIVSLAAYALVLWVLRTFDDDERGQIKRAKVLVRRRLPIGRQAATESGGTA